MILELGWSQPCDVWSIGCILFELYQVGGLVTAALQQHCSTLLSEQDLSFVSERELSCHLQVSFFVLTHTNDWGTKNSILHFMLPSQIIVDVCHDPCSQAAADTQYAVSRAITAFTGLNPLVRGTTLTRPQCSYGRVAVFAPHSEHFCRGFSPGDQWTKGEGSHTCGSNILIWPDRG